MPENALVFEKDCVHFPKGGKFPLKKVNIQNGKISSLNLITVIFYIIFILSLSYLEIPLLWHVYHSCSIFLYIYAENW